MASLRTHALTKSYGGRTVVKGVSLEVGSGEIVGLLTPSIDYLGMMVFPGVSSATIR